MCGIFGFALRKLIPLDRAFKTLRKLEVHQYPQEPKPVGGFGAGVAVLKNDGGVIFEKVGKVAGSPVEHLSKIVGFGEAAVLVGHVRMPSPNFMETAVFRETAQPYVSNCYDGLTVVSVHNGNITNYEEIRKKLGKAHVFESERVQLIDSEVVPHFFEELLKERKSFEEALNKLFCSLQGSSAVALLQVEAKKAFLHFVHMGKTRGLTIWTNEHGELVFCSRKEPLMEEFSNVIANGGFEEKISIAYGENVGLRFSCPLLLGKR
ncbi:MAG: class II glutamine amidotransferase [Candidatus Bathycorpusculaceae bacterium]